MLLVAIVCFFNLSGIIPESHHYHHYLFGSYATMTGNHQTAQKAFDIVFRNNGPHYAYEGLMKHFHATGQFNKIITFMPNIERYGTPNSTTMLLYAQALEHEGHMVQANAAYIKLAQEKPHQPDIIYHAVTTCIATNNIDRAMQLIDSYLEHDILHRAFIFHFLRAQILAQLGKDNSAIAELKKSVALQPRFEQAWLLLGLIHQKNGERVEALKAFKECAACGAKNPMLDRQIMELEKTIEA